MDALVAHAAAYQPVRPYRQLDLGEGRVAELLDGRRREPTSLEGLRVGAGVFNIFDATYYDAISAPGRRTQPDEFYTEPGRNFRLELSFTF